MIKKICGPVTDFALAFSRLRYVKLSVGLKKTVLILRTGIPLSYQNSEIEIDPFQLITRLYKYKSTMNAFGEMGTLNLN